MLLFELKPELALLIIMSCVLNPNHQIKLTQSGTYRLKKYTEGKINFLLAVDVLQELTIAYFIAPLGIKLSTSQELLLISRILQGRTWGQTLGKTGLTWNEANGLLMKAIKKIAGAIFFLVVIGIIFADPSAPPAESPFIKLLQGESPQ